MDSFLGSGPEEGLQTTTFRLTARWSVIKLRKRFISDHQREPHFQESTYLSGEQRLTEHHEQLRTRRFTDWKWEMYNASKAELPETARLQNST